MNEKSVVKIEYVSTASFCVENARELGIPAALLLDKIVRLSRSTTRQDGFCWYTAKQFEEETSLTEKVFTRAAQKLEEYGIVERKVTYIIGTMLKATHFKLLKRENQKPSRRPVLETVSETGSVNTINNTINMPSPADAGSGTSQPRQASSRPTASTRPASKEEKVGEGLDSLPFDEDVHVVDVKAKVGQTANARAGAILRKFGDSVGISTGGNRNKEVHRIKQLLDAGLTEEDILWIAEWSKSSDFYKDSSLMSRLSADAVDQADLAKKKRKENRLTW